MKILVNNNVVSMDLPAIHSNDRGFLFGDGIFETIKVESGCLLFFQEHYRRLKISALKLEIPFKFSLLELKNQCMRLLKINSLLKSAALRITLTRGISQTGFQTPLDTLPPPTLVIRSTPYGDPCGRFDSTSSSSSTLHVVTSVKRNESSLLNRVKTLNRLEFVLTRQKAVRAGYQEGLMLNTKGAVSETSIGNLFAVIDGKIFTPRIEDGIFPGIVRAIVIRISAQIGNSVVEEKTLYPEDLLEATEIFQTNSLVGIQPFSKINRHVLLLKEKAAKTRFFFDRYQNCKEEYIKFCSD
ncbi:aminodeoxychorismate lyase [Coxiella endosymbiont of Amblyomma sculptum]|uniref:aminotransferase class IV n=1 Tax=Coxiella endosymbiont of Amblyomma sculptum TaxID=2487929 RepID=UPI00132EDA7C|nr:aminodeoxychorismate lyase [Coxiella endosymbiont of Amblyomma sculptum]QHG92373.1 aminodeoxychorismate lyase [Coxiella endosymbiont of Amblyomma sculptum]